VVAAVFVGAPAVLLPSNARADDGPLAADAISGLTDATGVDVTLPAEADPVAASDVVAGALATVASATSGGAEAPSVAPGADASTEPAEVAAPSAGADEPASPATEPQSASDTTPVASDTTPDTAATRPAAASAPVAVQTAPTNVNVSVRIGSAGDNGPVTQTNVAAVVSSGAADAAAAPARDAVAAPSSTRSTAAVTPVDKAAPASAPQDDAGTWSWQWDCVSVPAISLISPGGYGDNSAPKNWTWIWNCGDNSGQYQDATAAQYQPSNVNVAIRIASPGNDGPVTQANVAVAVSAGVSVPHGASTSAGAGASAPAAAPSSVPTVSLPALALPPVPSIAAVLSPVVPSLFEPSAESGVAELLSPGLAPPVDGLDALAGLTLVAPPLVGLDPTAEPTRSVLALPAFRAGASRAWGVPASTPGTVWRGRVSSVRPSVTDGARGTPHGKRPPRAPRWRTRAPTTPAPAQAPPAASAAAAGSGGSSGGGLPFFLALPFVAAMLDLARRAALERVATPSGHRSRMPENPG
jgi:hypothetical protein